MKEKVKTKKYVIENAELMKEWNFLKNSSLNYDPSTITQGSGIKVHWICKKGHEWEAKINNRVNGRSCPVCSNKLIVRGINDLCTTHPKIAEEWDYSKNDKKPYEVSYGYGKKVWWICSYGHSYQATVNHRTGKNGTGCPICFQGQQTSFAEQAVYHYIKKVYPDAVNKYKEIFDNGMELDIYIPSIKLAIEYDGEAWHKENKFERELKKYKICQENNIKLIRLKEKRYNKDYLTANMILHIDKMYKKENLYKAILYIVSEISPETNMWTRTQFDHWYSNLEINLDKDEKDIREYMTKISKNSFFDIYPVLAKEWNYDKNGSLKPDMVKPGSDIKVWWFCQKCSNEYFASISHRVSGTGCPKCGIIKSAIARSKSVIAIDMKTNKVYKTFSSISEAGREMNISIGNITSVLKGTRKHTKGFTWRYVESDRNK